MWRNSGYSLRFFGIDGRGAFVVVLLLYAPSMKTLYIFLGTMATLFILEYFGYSIPNAFRKLQVLIAGNKRSAIPHNYK